MNKIFKTLAVTVLTFSTNNAVMANNDPIDFSALTGEYVATNPGLEIAVPSWTRIDNDADGIQDGYDFHFDVFKLGTKTKLFSTPAQYLPAIASGCKSIDDEEGLAKGDIDFKRIKNNLLLSVKMSVYCLSPEKEYDSSHIYAVNISVAGKAPWVKSFSGMLTGTGILPDKNGNGIGELSVVIETGTSSKNNNSDNTIYVYDGETGASLTTPVKYIIER